MGNLNLTPVSEYLARHNISLSPIFTRKPSNGHLIFFNESAQRLSERFRLYNLKWCHGGNHPSYYNFSRSHPNHNGAMEDNCFIIESDESIYWEQFTGHLHDIKITSASEGYKPVVSVYDRLLACFEMYVCISERALIDRLGINFFDLVFKVTHNSLPLDERMKNFEFAKKYIDSSMRPPMSKLFSDTFFDDASNWLAETMINE